MDTEITKGLRIGSRSKKDSNNGTPLSRGAADVDFSHINASANYKGIAFDKFQTSLSVGGQYSFSGSLLNSEQMGIAGESKLSGLASGAVSGDEAWFARAQVNRNVNLFINVKKEKNKPFFLSINTHDPHRYWARHPSETMEWVRNMMDGSSWQALKNGKPYPDPETRFDPADCLIPPPYPKEEKIKEVFIGVSSHPCLIISSVRRLTELAPLRSMFPDHSG